MGAQGAMKRPTLATEVVSADRGKATAVRQHRPERVCLNTMSIPGAQRELGWRIHNIYNYAKRDLHQSNLNPAGIKTCTGQTTSRRHEEPYKRKHSSSQSAVSFAAWRRAFSAHCFCIRHRADASGHLARAQGNTRCNAASEPGQSAKTAGSLRSQSQRAGVRRRSWPVRDFQGQIVRGDPSWSAPTVRRANTCSPFVSLPPFPASRLTPATAARHPRCG